MNKNPSGGYRRTWSFALVCIVYHATTIFCRRNFDHRNDALGKTVGQMVGAARSARQNIVEGSSRAAFSHAQEAFQYDVARGSLDELAGDYEAFILDREEILWSEKDPRAIEVAGLMVDKFEETEDVPHRYSVYILEMRRRFASWLEHEQPLVAAQAILITIRRAAAMLTTQINGLQDQDTKQDDSPHCSLCGSSMRKLTAKKGPGVGKQFWSCIRYPDCKGTISIR